MSATWGRDHPVVIGGGPAGLAAAIALSQAGARVLVVEPREMPIDKPCGEGLMPDAVAALAELGVGLGDAGRPIRGIGYFDGDLEARGLFPGAPGRGVRRLELHRRLLDRALELGVEVRRDRARGLRLEGRGDDRVAVVQTAPTQREEADRNRVSGSIEDGNFEEHRLGAEESRAGEIRTAVLVGADGLRSRVRTWAGLDVSVKTTRGHRRPRRRRRFGVRQHFALAPWSDRVEVHWSTGVEAYVTPCGASEVGVAVLFDSKALGATDPSPGTSAEPGPSKGPALDRLLVRFPRLLSRLEGSTPTSKAQGIGPLWQESRAVQCGPVALVGDASGYVDAITGEGMAIAFRQALALGDAFRVGRLDRYAAAHRRLVRRPVWMTRLVLSLSSRPGLRRRVLAALARDPELFDRLLAIHVGETQPLRIASSVARLGLGLASAR